MSFKNKNNLVGWLVFAISFFVYLKTMERTVSFWDCGEFLSVAYRLQVGHSPGAPLFMLLGRLFGMAADPMSVALFINSLSALSSALTILFLFWTITHFAKKLLVPVGDVADNGRMIAILGAGVVGALAYTFSDTFWFSAVEAEVYASSSFFTAVVFWAILKWEHHADEPGADRWLVLISYLMGLSIGVHLLNLLTIPALAMVYYFKRHKPTVSGGVVALLVGCLLLGFVQVGLIQGIPILASQFELWFVNSLGLPLNSGAIFFLILLAGLLGYFIYWTKRRGKRAWHTALLAVSFLLIGYSSYVCIIIRSNADTPIDMTNPDDVISLVSYLQRDQYGAQPLLFGPDYDSRPSGYKQGSTIYKEIVKDGNAVYEPVGHRQAEPEYPASEKRFFPRIWDQSQHHPEFYQQYLDIPEGESPTTIDNLKFFFSYQLNWMWWRYFMWNYAGRQNDYAGTSYGEPQNGNWISGISFVDKMLGRGDLDLMPEPYRHSRARNELYFFPFALGLLGLAFQFNRDRRDGLVVALLFFFTGIAIVLYLNNTPQQPRERDYAYAGATYAFAIWIGLGVLMVQEWIRKLTRSGVVASVSATLLCLLAVPALMAATEWDDHDRSDKTLARAAAYNVLASCDTNAILFVVGDNDTYPVWYLQEVEGYRTDVRVINLSLLGIDWYIDQLKYRINDAAPVPMIWTPEQYEGNKRNFIFYQQDPAIPTDRYFDIYQVLSFITSDDRRAQVQIVTGDYVNVLPTKNISIDVDKQAVLSSGLVAAEDSADIVSQIRFSLPTNTLTKSDIAVLNIIAGVAKEGWKRPIYFSCGFPGGDGYQGLDEYVRLEGVANKLVPVRTAGSSPSVGMPQNVAVEKSVDLFLNKFLWGGADRTDVYFDEPNKRMLGTYRFSGVKVAEALIREGKPELAKKLLDHITDNITYESYPYDQSMWNVVNAYYQVGDKETALQIAQVIVRDSEQMLRYLFSLPDSEKALGLSVDGRICLAAIQYMAQAATEAGLKAQGKEWEQLLQAYAQRMGVPM